MILVGASWSKLYSRFLILVGASCTRDDVPQLGERICTHDFCGSEFILWERVVLAICPLGYRENESPLTQDKSHWGKSGERIYTHTGRKSGEGISTHTGKLTHKSGERISITQDISLSGNRENESPSHTGHKAKSGEQISLTQGNRENESPSHRRIGRTNLPLYREAHSHRGIAEGGVLWQIIILKGWTTG